MPLALILPRGIKGSILLLRKPLLMVLCVNVCARALISCPLPRNPILPCHHSIYSIYASPNGRSRIGFLLPRKRQKRPHSFYCPSKPFNALRSPLRFLLTIIASCWLGLPSYRHHAFDVSCSYYLNSRPFLGCIFKRHTSFAPHPPSPLLIVILLVSAHDI